MATFLFHLNEANGKKENSKRVDKRTPDELLSAQKPVYNVDNYVDQHLRVFAGIHKMIRKNLTSRAEMMAEQHNVQHL